MARPLCGQLALDRGRRRPLEGARGPPAQRPLPKRRGQVRRCEPGLRRRPPLRGNGCVAADFDLDGRTDLYVTATGYDALLWNEGGGRFVEGAHAAGIDAYGWHTGATVGDVNADGLPDLFVAGYADLNAPVADAVGFPSTYAGVRDRLYLNLGPDASGRLRFRDVARRPESRSSWWSTAWAPRSRT